MSMKITDENIEIEKELTTLTLYNTLLGEWLVESDIQEKLSPLDILLWWSRSPEAEA